MRTYPNSLIDRQPRIADRLNTWSKRLLQRSISLVRFLDLRIDMLISFWITVVVVAGAAKVLSAPIAPRDWGEALGLLLPYLVIALAPFAGYRVAAGSFPRGLLPAQPGIRLARIGQWHQLDVIAARSNPLFGPAGFMASLLLGIILNVPVRTMEYLAAIPAVNSSAPGWAQLLFNLMTLDVLVMNFFYMVCFVMALRSVPLFPRMLLFAWILDLVIQLGIAHQLARAPMLRLISAFSIPLPSPKGSTTRPNTSSASPSTASTTSTARLPTTWTLTSTPRATML